MIEDDVARHARRAPDGIAAVAVDAAGRDSTLTWAELWERSGAAATTLLSFGVRAGDTVAYQLPNRLEFLTLTLGALRIGAICEPLMPIFRERELRFMLAESAAPVLIVPGRFRGHDHGQMARELTEELPAIRHLLVLGDDDPPDFESLEPDDEAVAARRPQLSAIAQLLFTSGSTGEPKGVMHRHEVLDRAADAHIAHFGLRSADVIYIPSPLAHQTGWLYGMWIAWRLGATQVVQESWDADVAFDAIGRHGVTFTQAATPFLADLVRVAEDRGGRAVRGTRCACSSPPAPRSHATLPAARVTCSTPRSAAASAQPRAAWAPGSSPDSGTNGRGRAMAWRWPMSRCGWSTTRAASCRPGPRATSRSAPTRCSPGT